MPPRQWHSPGRATISEPTNPSQEAEVPAPTLHAIEKAICCPRRERRCEGECPVAHTKHYAAAVAVRDEIQAAAKPRSLLEDQDVTPRVAPRIRRLAEVG